MTAIVCVAGVPPGQCSTCHRQATHLCDWKTGPGRTCDKSICPASSCNLAPAAAPGKNFCRVHMPAYERWVAEQARKAAAAAAAPATPEQKPLI